VLHKKITLAIVAFALAVGAFMILSRGDRSRDERGPKEGGEALRKFVSMPPSTQPTRVIQDGDIPFSPGDHTLARVYDDITGRLKYQFEAKTWAPVSETDFHLEDLLIQIFMPHGEITYISADEAQITLARKGRNRVDPKSGWIRGNVKVTIDRTTSEWREANPEQADRYAHPNDLINIDMHDAKFDMERAELVSEGAILVDSSDVRIEDVSGLTLQWDQLDNRIDVLHFKQGGRMTLRRGGKMVDFAMPGTQRDVSDKEPAAQQVVRTPGRVSVNEVPEASAEDQAQRALAMKPMSIKTVSAEQAAAEIRVEGSSVTANRPRALPAADRSQPTTDQAYQIRTPEALAEATQKLKDEARAGTAGVALDPKEAQASPAPKRKKIQTYRAVFTEQVVVEQKDGLRTIGKLEANNLEINFDFGEKQKSLTGTRRSQKGPAATSGPAGQEETASARTGSAETASPHAAPPSTPMPGAAPSLEDDRTKLVLSWSGPLDLRPLQVDPAEQSGQRFDAIATGSPVRVQSEQGNATCAQLVYRHERRQAWLAGTETEPVELAVNESRKLQGREVFFDQKRGLALVDGAGVMTDVRKESANGKAGDSLIDSIAGASSGEGKPGGKKRGPVEIRWARGVELELGFRPIERINPSTGLKEKKQREFLQRAWFHGDVSIKQGEDRIAAQEIAVTFGHPVSKEEVADHIQHLNMVGDVRLDRGKEYITAERLDAEMIVTPSRRNVPRVVDAEGKVRVKQGDREIRAETMHVVLAESRTPAGRKPADKNVAAFGDSRLGVESLDAKGDVYVHDGARNLRIRKAETLKAAMRDANQLESATIASSGPDVLARVRYGDTAIHGQLIQIQMEEESVEVPGPGQAWMMTQQDFTGRKLRKPSPVKVSWADSMQFRLARNVGWFAGKVHCESQTFSLDSDKLNIRFGKAPPIKETRKEGIVERFYLLGEIVGDKAQVKEVAATPLSAERKRPVYVAADGNAQAMSAEYAPNTPDGQPGRLRSRLWISGDQIAADLAREQLSVPAKGSLLIEDYQFETPQEQASLSRKAAATSSPLMSTMQDEGPSQTAVTWDNSMDFFLDRGLVAFDKNVSMIHRSGQELVLREELSAAMRIENEQLQQMNKGRKATLSCGHLLLEFLTREPDKSTSDSAAPAIRATDLKRLIAKQAVHLQESTKSLMGEYLQYTNETNEVRLEGSSALEARIIDQDERDQRLTMWRGPLLVWDRRTNRIEAPGANIRASRR
jgi:lipopolysaccharide export system protein LptA